MSLFFQELSRPSCSFNTYMKRLNSLLWISFFFGKVFAYITKQTFSFGLNTYSERGLADLVFVSTRVGDVTISIPSATTLYRNRKKVLITVQRDAEFF